MALAQYNIKGTYSVAFEDLKYYEKYMPESSCGEIINYSYYSVSFCEQYKLSEWSIHLLTKERLLNAQYPRKSRFRQDPNLNGRDASVENYRGSGYDKGHLVPMRNMAFNEVGLSESLFMTNIAPQNPSFNRGRMKELEYKFRSWVKDFDEIVIITGFVKDPEYIIEYIGPNQVPVPAYFYKIFIDIGNRRSIAFLLPNEKITKNVIEYSVSIDYLESITGLDFFYKLSDEIELLFEIDSGDIEKLK
tara:strand:- start:338 stop:1078 length:741 start_codon:yes stop_codon:yes gene_type:complete